MFHPIILYDGVCGLCNRLNQFVLRRDRTAIFRFATLQSNLAAHILARHGATASDLDTVYVVIDPELPGEYLLSRSDAIAFILKNLGGVWGAWGLLARVVPGFVRDRLYGIVARNRYRIFGRFESCMVPSPETRDRFLDI
jgi:predicted DCC family thiol-disulfide oxidoreductase YuxK